MTIVPLSEQEEAVLDELIQQSEDVLNAPANNKYLREIKAGVFVDVYDVLKAWDVRNPALQHLIKKALQAGGRGHKDLKTDLADITASAIRAQELEE